MITIEGYRAAIGIFVAKINSNRKPQRMKGIKRPMTIKDLSKRNFTSNLGMIFPLAVVLSLSFIFLRLITREALDNNYVLSVILICSYMLFYVCITHCSGTFLRDKTDFILKQILCVFRRKAFQKFYSFKPYFKDVTNMSLQHNYVLIILGLLVCIIMNFLKLTLLLQDGDVETNPGPQTFTVLKSIQGSFNQGDAQFGETAGRQCSCNALYAIGWSAIRRVGLWSMTDLDHILIEGDKIYKSLNSTKYLSIEDLPHTIMINSINLIMVKLNVYQYSLLSVSNNSVLNELYRNEENHGQGMILIFDMFTISIIWNKANFFLFDSHSRDVNGNIIENGSSVLLKFRSLNAVEKYLKLTYINDDSLSLTVDIAFIAINAEESELQLLERDVSCEIKRKRKQQYNIDFSVSPGYANKKRRGQQYKAENYESFKSSDKYPVKLAQSQQYKAENYETFKSSEKYLVKLAQSQQYKAENYESFKSSEKYSVKLAQSQQYKAENYESFKSSEKYPVKLMQSQQYKAESYETFKSSEKYPVKLMQSQQYKAESYETFKSSEKYAVKLAQSQQYKAENYESFKNSEACTRKKLSSKKKYEQSKGAFSDSEKIAKFKLEVRKGPYHVCVICNRSLYRRSVILFDETKYIMPDEDDFFISHVLAFDGHEYICLTCNQKLKKSKVPCQAVCNKLEIFDFPVDVPKLRRLEKTIIARRILFKKIAIMPKGQSPKLKGAICNVPLESDSVCDTLPRGADSNGVVMVKLKRKLMYRGHVYFEPVRPDVIKTALNFLKEHNLLYRDITINISQIPDNLLALQQEPVTTGSSTDLPNASEQILEETENPLDEFRVASNETALISNIPTSFENETLTIAPCEGKKPISLLMDKHCEELAHPYLLPTGKFGYKVERKVSLSPSKYFNQRLLNYKQKFASDADYIFFAHSLYQQLTLTGKMNIAMKKVSGSQLSAGMLSTNFKETVKTFIANDEAYRFMSSVKGTPAYWKKFLFEVLAMVKNLGLPTFFMTLSCADLRWAELPYIISKLNGVELSDVQINEMDYETRCNLLNSNPVLLARHFQYRVETFFKEIIVNGPLGITNYHAIRVEFQMRGSPHIHSFLWIKGAPKLTAATKDEYITFIDKIVKAELPNPETEAELFNLVRTYQVHSHCRSCRKYKNVECRYDFGRLFTDRTIVAEPLPADLSANEKVEVLKRRNIILNKVKDYINLNLDPKKVNIFYSSKEGYVAPPTISQVLSELNISEEDYYHALSISSDDDFEIHLKRPTTSCFINNYFAVGLQAWLANIDIQPVFNHYKAVSYMCAYFSRVSTGPGNPGNPGNVLDFICVLDYVLDLAFWGLCPGIVLEFEN